MSECHKIQTSYLGDSGGQGLAALECMIEAHDAGVRKGRRLEQERMLARLQSRLGRYAVQQNGSGSSR